MQLRREADGVVVTTPAKLNLFFEILARRPDGYHEIESLMAPLAVFDTLVFRDLGPLESDGKAGVALDCEWAAGLRKRGYRCMARTGARTTRHATSRQAALKEAT